MRNLFKNKLQITSKHLIKILVLTGFLKSYLILVLLAYFPVLLRGAKFEIFPRSRYSGVIFLLPIWDWAFVLIPTILAIYLIRKFFPKFIVDFFWVVIFLHITILSVVILLDSKNLMNLQEASLSMLAANYVTAILFFFVSRFVEIKQIENNGANYHLGKSGEKEA